jgi:hypothetical protein
MQLWLLPLFVAMTLLLFGGVYWFPAAISLAAATRC